jgi:hypothetical protein
VASLISGETPLLYLRKLFQASSSQASITTHVLLEIDYDDGFIVFLNGKEVARSRMGAANGFAYADQFSIISRPNDSGSEVDNLGPADEILNSGENLLAVQAHNGELSGDLLAKVSLTFDGASEIVSESFDSTADDTRMHERTGASESNTAAGSPASGSWLDKAADPQSSSAWSHLVIVTEEYAAIGFSDAGALRYMEIRTSRFL